MSDLKTIEQLLNEVQTISESYERVAEATGEHFNIFSVLKMETDEVSTHSRFIAELLNSNGAHGQKDEFLNLFTEIFSNLKFQTLNAKVKTEHSTDNGRIDIIIMDTSNNVIIIENKIYAKEQKNQLLRYSNDFPEKAYNREIFYLTLYGEQSKENSSKGIKYKPISYENDIIKWLEKCKEKAVDIPILRETISQYINLIKKLTNQNLNKNMSQEIANRVIKDKNTFSAFGTLVSSRKEVFNAIIREKVIPILENMQKEYGLKLNLNRDKILSSKRFVGFSFENDRVRSNNLKIFFEFESSYHDQLVFGLKYINKETKENYNEILNNFNKEFGIAKNSKNALCYQNYNGFYENWENRYDILEKILFGNFEKDIKDKVEKMLNIL